MVFKNHIKQVHESEKNFQCGVCKKCFPTSQYLMDHMEEVHKKSRDLKCSRCSKCDKSYKQSQTILRHIRNFHEGRCLLVILCYHTKEMLEISVHERIRIDSNKCGNKYIIIKLQNIPNMNMKFKIFLCDIHLITCVTFEFLFLFMNCIRMI